MTEHYRYTFEVAMTSGEIRTVTLQTDRYPMAVSGLLFHVGPANVDPDKSWRLTATTDPDVKPFDWPTFPTLDPAVIERLTNLDD